MKWFFVETSTVLKGRVDILGSDVYIGTEVQPKNTSSCTISNNSFKLREEEMSASEIRVARNRGKGHHNSESANAGEKAYPGLHSFYNPHFFMVDGIVVYFLALFGF